MNPLIAPIRLNGFPYTPRQLSHIAGQHWFYLEADGRVRVSDGANDGPGAPFYLANGKFRLDSDGAVSIRIVTEGGSAAWTREPPAGALALIEALVKLGYHAGTDTSAVKDFLKLAEYSGYP